MPGKNKANQELCPLCAGIIQDQLITHEERDAKGTFYIFENVPARVCSQCGEVWLPASTLEILDKILEEAKPTKTVKTPVFDLAGQRR